MLNPGGSVKDRIGVAMIEAAEAEGRIEPGRTTIVEATSGNTGIALAFVCAAKGYDLILTLPQGMSREREGLLRLYGAQVQVTESMGGMNEAVAAAQALARDDDFWLPDQFSNPANPEAHRAHAPGRRSGRRWTASVDCLVAGVGTGGTITGAGALPEGAQPGAAGGRGRAAPPRRCCPAGGPGRTRSRASARASSRRCSTATCSTRSSPSTTRTRSRPRAWSRAARACWPASRAARRCGRRSRSPSAPEAAGKRIAVVLPDSRRALRLDAVLRPRARRRRRGMMPARGRGPAGAPWERPLHGDARPAGRRVRRCWPATRSATRRAGRCTSTGRPASSSTTRSALPSVYVIQGYTGQLDMWVNRAAVRADDDRAPRRDVRRAATARTRSSCSSTRGRRFGGSQFLNSTGTGPLPGLPVRRGRRRSSTSATRRSPSRDHRGLTGKSSRRLRRDGRADAAPGRVRRARLARRRRAVRVLLPAGVPAASRASCATTSTAPGTSFFERAARRRPPRLGAVREPLELYGYAAAYSPDPEQPGQGAAAVRRRDRAADRRRLGAVARARTRCGWRRATPTRCARCAASTSTPGKQRRVLPRPRRAGVRAPSSTSSASSTRSSSSTARTAASTYRYPGAIRELVLALAPERRRSVAVHTLDVTADTAR